MIDVFKVGVTVAMHTNSAEVLSKMIAGLTGVHIAAGKAASALGQIRTAALAAGAAFVGWEVGKGLWHAIEGNRELNKELEKTKQLGGAFAANLGDTRAAAFRTVHEAPTSVVADNVRLARELGTTIGHPQAAMEMLSEATKVAYLVHNYTGEAQEDIVKNLIRTADARAQIYKVGPDGKEHVDPEKLKAEMEAAYKGLILGGGFATSAGMLQTARMGGAVVKEQTPEAFYAAGVEASIALGAARLGTAETSLMSQFIGGTMTKRVAEHLTEAGLLKANEWHSGNSGGVVIDPKAAAKFEPMMKDPIAWLSTGEGGETIKAYALKEGISITSAIMQLFGRQTTQRLANDAMSNEPQFARAREIYGNIPDVQAAYKELHANDIGTNLTEIASAWKSFMQAFSDAGTPLLIPLLHGLTNAIHLLMDGAANYPIITGALIAMASSLAALTVLGGSLVILNATWAPLVAGLRLLCGVAPLMASTGTAATALAGGLGALGSAVSAFLAVLPAAYGAFKGAVMTGADTAKHAENGEIAVGFDEFGHPLGFRKATDAEMGGKSRYVAPPAASAPLTENHGPVRVIVENAKDLASGVSNHIADKMSRPQSGPTGPDLRYTPPSPGMGLAY